MTVHPGDYVLVESFDFPSRFKTKIKAVYENYAIDDKGNKLNYCCLSGIPLDEGGLSGFGFLMNRFETYDMFTKDCLSISVSHVKYDPIVTIGFNFKGRTSSDLRYLHEVQHFYFDEYGTHLQLTLQQKRLTL